MNSITVRGHDVSNCAQTPALQQLSMGEGASMACTMSWTQDVAARRLSLIVVVSQVK